MVLASLDGFSQANRKVAGKVADTSGVAISDATVLLINQKDTLKGDLEKIRSFYLDRGYLRFDIESNTVAVSPDKNSVYVTLQVKEGVQYTIKGIEFV